MNVEQSLNELAKTNLVHEHIIRNLVREVYFSLDSVFRRFKLFEDYDTNLFAIENSSAKNNSEYVSLYIKYDKCEVVTLTKVRGKESLEVHWYRDIDSNLKEGIVQTVSYVINKNLL